MINPPKDDDKNNGKNDNKGGDNGNKNNDGKGNVKQAIIKPVKVWMEGGGRVVKAGSSVNMKVAVTNNGDLTARNVYVYMDKQSIGPRSRPSVEVKRGFNIRALTPGWTVTGTVTIFFGKKARGKVAITAQAWGNYGKKILVINRR